MGDKKKQKKSGLGTKFLAALVLAGLGIGAAFYFAPDAMQDQVQALRTMLGV